MGRPIRYLGSTRFALGSLDVEGLHGWVEHGQIVEVPPRLAVDLLREPEQRWQHASRRELVEQEEG